MLDARLNFNQQVEHVSAKAPIVRTRHARLMPNVGGPKQTRRISLSSMVSLVLTYGITIWADALKTQSRRMTGPIYCLNALRIAFAFRTILEEAVCVILGTLPLLILAEDINN
ncbi:uncharacterized protein LOC113367240 [Ctenocephalides felis]|uniref:uncharacterized protein LOC113367240 n=1 Tax=Ctenocephalides felis TaxID=7515 RepID=UPI000E6E1FFE|nr:uncharacterized protein LOC113367240 [Ctenocephalides felis]